MGPNSAPLTTPSLMVFGDDAARGVVLGMPCLTFAPALYGYAAFQ